jgi:hypothetical protein
MITSMARALALACVLCLARADVDIGVDMLVPAEIGLNMTKFEMNLRSWVPAVNETFNSTNTTSNTTSNITKAPPNVGFFLPMNIRVAVAALNNILCVTGANLTQCYNERPETTPTPTPTPTPPPPAPVAQSSEETSIYLILGVTLSASFLLVAAALAILLCRKPRRVTSRRRARWWERDQTRASDDLGPGFQSERRAT